ncbi:hypothetical protein AMAG_08941 [Allomyces macrogynus ATCC 38327]|uniref:Uncharacterized protein n=1 Tax=Allomyces macrogynus (strain ATCC 38327) TaxID=578462 RepID=A0A0L0SN00_ALLM3|nr:hypothetical protein AMAG_08941 [Allomyces macrogynus ATCC 38327]|eukprot:KNE63878.1 hypothetical protein AMAG_08941 [Allomyces macrogynus ATCC 38327]
MADHSTGLNTDSNPNAAMNAAVTEAAHLDDLDSVINAGRILGGHTRRDLAWGKTLLACIMHCGHVAGIHVVQDRWPVLLHADDALRGEHDGMKRCLDAAAGMLKKLTENRCSDVVRGLVAAFRAEVEFALDPARRAMTPTIKTDSRTLVDLAMTIRSAQSPLLRELVPIARMVYAELSVMPQVAPLQVVPSPHPAGPPLNALNQAVQWQREAEEMVRKYAASNGEEVAAEVHENAMVVDGMEALEGTGPTDEEVE